MLQSNLAVEICTFISTDHSSYITTGLQQNILFLLLPMSVIKSESSRQTWTADTHELQDSYTPAEM